MTRHEVGLMLLVLVLSVAGGISWRLFRPHRGAHVYDLAPVPIPRLECGSMILEEETRLRGDWQDAYVRELAPETLDEEAADDDRWPVQGIEENRLPGLPDHIGLPSAEPAPGSESLRRARTGVVDGDGRRAAAIQPDLISVMSDEDFFHMARFEFRRLEWMASEPLTLPAWTGRAA